VQLCWDVIEELLWQVLKKSRKFNSSISIYSLCSANNYYSKHFNQCTSQKSVKTTIKYFKCIVSWHRLIINWCNLTTPSIQTCHYTQCRTSVTDFKSCLSLLPVKKSWNKTLHLHIAVPSWQQIEGLHAQYITYQNRNFFYYLHNYEIRFHSLGLACTIHSHEFFSKTWSFIQFTEWLVQNKTLEIDLCLHPRLRNSALLELLAASIWSCWRLTFNMFHITSTSLYPHICTSSRSFNNPPLIPPQSPVYSPVPPTRPPEIPVIKINPVIDIIRSIKNEYLKEKDRRVERTHLICEAWYEQRVQSKFLWSYATNPCVKWTEKWGIE